MKDLAAKQRQKKKKHAAQGRRTILILPFHQSLILAAKSHIPRLQER
jgi:hypothetical protein